MLVFTAIGFVVTIVFQRRRRRPGRCLRDRCAGADDLGRGRGDPRRERARAAAARGAFGLIALVFAYTTAVNVVERPDGLKIAAFFIGAIVVVSLVSRVWRSTELRVTEIELDETARALHRRGAAATRSTSSPTTPTSEHARVLAEGARGAPDNNIPPGEPVLFLEVTVRERRSSPPLHVRGEQIGGYRVLRAEGTAVANAIAALLLCLRDTTGPSRTSIRLDRRESAQVSWPGSSSSAKATSRPVTHEVLRRAEPDPARRPAIHVG